MVHNPDAMAKAALVFGVPAANGEVATSIRQAKATKHPSRLPGDGSGSIAGHWHLSPH